MPEWMKAGNTAVVTGGASGIGREAARRFADAGMAVAILDHDDDALETARAELVTLAGSTKRVAAVRCDVGDFEAMEGAAGEVADRFGAVHLLMNNAGIGRPVGSPWEDRAALDETLATNLFGVVNGCHAFMPAMLAHGEAGAVVNTGSKQGITRPPGNYAYNLSKAGVLAYTESVAHALATRDGCRLTAHLLVPGFVYTPMVSAHVPDKPAFAWTAGETVDFLLPRLDAGDFYILCPDGETPRALDEKRVRWNADDIIENRPALSRWHPDWRSRYAAFVKD